MAHDDSTLPPPAPAPLPALPGDHLAFVVEDLLAAVEAGSGLESGTNASRLRAALLYGWAIGIVGSRELAARSATDLGLQHLLGGWSPSFAEIRDFRDAQRAALEADLGVALAIARAAGLTRLGQIVLPRQLHAGGDASYLALARGYLDGAEATDQRDDRELGVGARGDELPRHLVARTRRQETFRQLATGGMTIRPPSRGRTVLRALASAAATLLLLLAGLLLIRWVGAANAEVSYTGQARVPVAAAPPSAAPTPTSTPLAVSLATPTTDELTAASDEAIRLGILALATDDVATARDFFLLAREAMPDNSVAVDRLRQVETVLTIDERSGDWGTAVQDLGELRRLAPGSATVLGAYVSALVGAGQEALAAGDAPQAIERCTEASRWLPARPDAQACLNAASQGARSIPTPVAPSATPRIAPPTSTASSVATPSPTPGAPGAGVTDLRGPGPELQLALSGRCVPAAAGARSLQVEGTVSVGGATAVGATVQLRIQDAQGRVVDNSSFPVASQRFAVQRTVAGVGMHTVTATASLEGYEAGEDTLRVSC